MYKSSSDLTDFDKLSSLSSSGLSPEQIKVGIEQGYSLSRGLNLLDKNKNKMGVVYTTTNGLRVNYITGNTVIRYTFNSSGPNNIIGLHKVDVTNVTTSTLDSIPLENTYYNVFTATSGITPASMVVSSTTEGINSTPIYTGGWITKANGDPSIELVSTTLRIDDVDVTNDGNISMLNVYKVEYETINNIAGEGIDRYVLQERTKYTIIDGIIEITTTLTAIESVIISQYQGLQTQSTNGGWDDTILFRGSEYPRMYFLDDLNSGDKYNSPVNSVSQRGDYELESWIDNSVGLGRREYVQDSRPNVYTNFDERKVYHNLVDGIYLSLLRNETATWSGGMRVRLTDNNRI